MAPHPSRARQQAGLDLVIVIAVFALGSLTVPLVNPTLRRGHGLPTALLAAMYQFMLEGIAPLALIARRRETPRDFALERTNAGRSLVFALLLAALYDAGMTWRAGAAMWVPLRRQPAIRMSLEAGMPLGLIGIVTTAAVWGALEGFFGVYFWRKVSRLVGVDTAGWMDPGVLAFAAFNGGIHLVVGQGFEGFLTSFASGYAIAVIPATTGNAWGSLLFQTLTNAVGHW